MPRQSRRAVGGTRQLAILVVVALATFAVAGSAVAGHLDSAVKSYTGCLTTVGGTLVMIREGNSPAKPCPKGSVEAHFSGGDITAVTAGIGLTGGGTNGDVSIALDPAYALRQDCADGDVVKWDGSTDEWACADNADTTYSAGEGLVLAGTEFSLDPDYALPDCSLGDSVVWTSTQFSLGEWGCAEKADADQDCPTDEFANGIDEFGELECADPAGGGGGGAGVDLIEFSQGSDFGNGVGIPDDGAYRGYASGSITAGTWLSSRRALSPEVARTRGAAGSAA